jgi:hypothetical protein
LAKETESAEQLTTSELILYSKNKILKLYLFSTLLSGLSLALFWALPSLISTKLNQAHVIMFVASIMLTVYYALINLVFFVSLSEKMQHVFKRNGIILIFYLPSLFTLIFLLKDAKLNSDFYIYLLSVLINILCITTGHYFIFWKKWTRFSRDKNINQ